MRTRIAFTLLALYVALVPLMRLHATFLGSTVIAADFLFPFLLLSVLAVRSLRRRLLDVLRRTPSLTLYLAAFGLAAVFSQDHGTSMGKLATTTYLVLIAAVTAALVSSRPAFQRMVTVWLAAAAVTAGVALFEVLEFYLGWREGGVDYGSLPTGSYVRTAGPFLNYNMFANFLIVSVVLAWARARDTGARSYGMLLALLLAISLFTFSPGLGGLALALGLLTWLAPPRFLDGLISLRIAAFLTGTLAAAAMIVAATVLPGEMLGGNVRAGPRLAAWMAALPGILDHPLVGAGPGVGFVEVTYADLRGHLHHLTDPHNMWLSLAGQAGVVGAAALLWLTACVMARSWGALGGDSDAGYGVALLVAVITAWFYHGLLGSYEDTRHLWVLLGLALAWSSLPAPENGADDSLA